MTEKDECGVAEITQLCAESAALRVAVKALGEAARRALSVEAEDFLRLEAALALPVVQEVLRG